MFRHALGNRLANEARHAAESTTIYINIKTNEDAVSIAMEDTGDAIPAKYLERVFGRFFRADPARQHSSESNGLGLTTIVPALTAPLNAVARIVHHRGDQAGRGIQAQRLHILRHGSQRLRHGSQPFTGYHRHRRTCGFIDEAAVAGELCRGTAWIYRVRHTHPPENSRPTQ